MADLAARQHSLVTAGQLRSMKVSDHQRRHLVATGALRPVRRAVYTLPGVAPSWEQTLRAAVLAAGAGAVVSHRTAGALWQLKHCPRRPRSG
jgi:Transcriptional regulator, AbiEi antitoxin N-terminal domain